MKYYINYGSGKNAELYTPSEDWESRFYELAGQCFGIRKAIEYAHLIEKEDASPPYLVVGEYERLCHNGDTIVWNEAGEKIKSEWD